VVVAGDWSFEQALQDVLDRFSGVAEEELGRAEAMLKPLSDARGDAALQTAKVFQVDAKRFEEEKRVFLAVFSFAKVVANARTAQDYAYIARINLPQAEEQIANKAMRESLIAVEKARLHAESMRKKVSSLEGLDLLLVSDELLVTSLYAYRDAENLQDKASYPLAIWNARWAEATAELADAYLDVAAQADNRAGKRYNHYTLRQKLGELVEELYGETPRKTLAEYLVDRKTLGEEIGVCYTQATSFDQEAGQALTMGDYDLALALIAQAYISYEAVDIYREHKENQNMLEETLQMISQSKKALEKLGKEKAFTNQYPEIILEMAEFDLAEAKINQKNKNLAFSKAMARVRLTQRIVGLYEEIKKLVPGGDLEAGISYTFKKPPLPKSLPPGKTLIIYGAKAAQEDKEAANLISERLGGLGVETQILEDSRVVSEQLVENNLVLVGGPAANKITKQLNPSLDAPFSKYGPNWLISDGTTTYQDVDIGLINILPNPYNPRKAVIVVAGITRSGTQAAAKILVGNPANIVAKGAIIRAVRKAGEDFYQKLRTLR